MAKLTEFQSKKIIEQAGILVPRSELIFTRDGAEQAAVKIGFPVMLKIQVLCASRFKKGYIKEYLQ